MADILCRVCANTFDLKPMEEIHKHILTWMFRLINPIFESQNLKICSTCCRSVKKYNDNYYRKQDPKYRVALVVWDDDTNFPKTHQNGKPLRYSIAPTRKLNGTNRRIDAPLDENEIQNPPQSTNLPSDDLNSVLP